MKKTSEPPSNRVDALIALRDTIAVSIENCESLRDLASLSREYRAVMAELADLAPPEKKGDAIDEIAQRRAARRSTSTKSTGRAKRTS